MEDMFLQSDTQLLTFYVLWRTEIVTYNTVHVINPLKVF